MISNISSKLGKNLVPQLGQLLQESEAPYFEVNAPADAVNIVNIPLKNIVTLTLKEVESAFLLYGKDFKKIFKQT